MVPVRCWTCGAMVGEKLEAYQRTGALPPRYCCRRMLLGYVDTVSSSLRYVQEVHDPPPVAGSSDTTTPINVD